MHAPKFARGGYARLRLSSAFAHLHAYRRLNPGDSQRDDAAPDWCGYALIWIIERITWRVGASSFPNWPPTLPPT
jgi:hypothetical protein